MKSHVWRPMFVVLAVVVLVLAARKFLVPSDFGIGERGYMYGWHRAGNERQWKEVQVKYKTAAYCMECHRDKYDEMKESPHRFINCENCHGPALNHPDEPRTLLVDRSRELCARCHTRLPYPSSSRGVMKGIDPKTHNVGLDCVDCHWPHDPRKEGHKR